LTTGTHRPLEDPLTSLNSLEREIVAGASESFEVGECEAKTMYVLTLSTRAVGGVRTEMPVSANDSAQIATAIVGGLNWLSGKGTSPDEIVVGGQVSSVSFAGWRVQDMLPAAVTQKPVVSACD